MSDADIKNTVLITNDGSLTLKNSLIDEAYHSLDGASLEASALYLQASGLQAGLLSHKSSADSPLVVFDIGLGLAYNTLVTIEHWLSAEDVCQSLNIYSFECDEKLVKDLLSLRGLWMQNWNKTWLSTVSKISASTLEITLPHPKNHSLHLYWKIIVGDLALTKLKKWSLPKADYIWQDAFSPQKNPNLWDTEWFHTLKQNSNLGVILVTYSVARPVKDSLNAASWTYELIPTQTKKRNWLRARLAGLVPTND